MVYVFGVLIVIYAQASFPASAEHVIWVMTVAPTYSSFFLLFLPLLTLIVSWIRSRLNKPELQQGAAP
jgi:hypothetical protein